MAVLRITCPSCGGGIEIPNPERDRIVVRCPKCGKGFPLLKSEEKDGAASEDRERAAAKKRHRPGLIWGFACARIFLPLTAMV